MAVSVDPNARYKKKKDTVSGFTEARRKRQEDEAYSAETLKKQTAEQEEKKKKEAQSKESVATRAKNIAGGVGNFVKDAAIDVKDTAVGAWQGLGDVARGELASNEMEEKTRITTERNKEWSQKFGQASDQQWQDPEFVKAAKAHTAETKKLGEVSKQSQDDLDTAQKVDAKKVAFQSAETFLNVATLGVGTPIKAGGKAVVKQGAKAVAKQTTKQAFKTALKTGGTEAVEQIIKQGGEAALKRAAQEALEETAEKAVVSGGRKLAGNMAKDAAIGGAYGVTQTGKRDPDADLNDYLLNVAFGAGIGAAVPVVGAGGKKVVSSIKGKGTAKVADKVAKEVDPSDVNTIMNKAIDEQSEKYGTTALSRVKNWIGEQIDPYRAAVKVDDEFASANGIKRNKLNSEDSLEDLLRRSAASEREAASLFDSKLVAKLDDGTEVEGSAADLVKKYKGDSDIGREFNNYTNAKFLQEIRAKKPNYQLPQGLDDQKLDDFIREYEARNLDATKDLALKKSVNDMAVDYMERANVITAEEANVIKTAYKYAVPLEKVFPDDLQRPQVTGKNLGSIAKQTVTQRLEQGSDVPLSNSFDTMLNRVYKAVSQGNRAKVAQKLLERAEQGLVKGADVTVTAGNKEARKEIRSQAQVLTKGVKYLQGKVKVDNKQLKQLDRELKLLGLQEERAGAVASTIRESAESIVPLLKENAPKSLDDLSQSYKVKDQLLKAYGYGGIKSYTRRAPEKVFSVEQMAADIHNGGWKQLMELNPSISEATAKSIAKQVLKAPSASGKVLVKEGKLAGKTTTESVLKRMLNSSEADIRAIQKKIETRQPKLAAKLEQVINKKAEIDALKIARTNLKDVTADFMDDPVTGKQMISGVIDGQGFKMEVPPELAKALMGLDQQKLPSVLKALAIIKKPFEVTWTGVLNPVFSAISFALYDTPMSVINSPQGLRTLGPKAVVESIKSIKSSSEFQRRLAAEGARPYGGSGASSFIKPTAKSIAAQRNILQNIKYTATNPEVALSKLDIWGGKLANATRTRTARAAYDDTLRIAKKAAKENGIPFDKADPILQKRAMENAALAYRSIMPDFDTMSNLTRQINSVVPFFAASTAGTRSFGKALRRDPLGTGIKALSLGVIPTVGVTAYSLASPQGQAFYDEMEKTSPRTLDDNMIVVLPGAHKDDKTGEWKGIIKIPLAPEFRAINRTTWRETRAAVGKGEGPAVSHVAWSLFDAVTGGVRSSQNPLIDTVRILAGEDPRTGERIIKGDMANLPQSEQTYDTTSGAAKWLAGKMGTSPIQADKFISQFGIAGQTVKNGGNPVEATAKNIDNRFTGAYGESISRSFYDTYGPIKARRDKASREVTDLVKQGKRNEARRKAEEFNATLGGSFTEFAGKYGGSEDYNADWDEMLNGLFIRTGEQNFDARAKP